MQIKGNRDQFLEQMQAAVRVASARPTVQSLTGVQLIAKSNGVELQSTDGEVSLRTRLEATVETEGALVLPARLLLDLARSLPSGDFTLTQRQQQQDVEIKSGSAVINLRMLRSEDFPKLPSPGKGQSVDLDAATFVSTADKVVRSASRDETRPILTGVLISGSEQSLRMVATDSYRLSVQETKLEKPLSSSLDANVPARALQELSRLVGESEAPLSVSLDERQIVFSSDSFVLSSRLIDGQFPDYNQLLPEAFDYELELDGSEFSDVVRRVSLLAQKNAPLRLALTDGQITISAQTPDVGEATESLPVAFSGEPLEIGFNPEFLRDGIESVGSDRVRLRLISPLRPGLIEPADDSGFIYLIMPIRLNN